MESSFEIGWRRKNRELGSWSPDWGLFLARRSKLFMSGRHFLLAELYGSVMAVISLIVL